MIYDEENTVDRIVNVAFANETATEVSSFGKSETRDVEIWAEKETIVGGWINTRSHDWIVDESIARALL